MQFQTLPECSRVQALRPNWCANGRRWGRIKVEGWMVFTPAVAPPLHIASFPSPRTAHLAHRTSTHSCCLLPYCFCTHPESVHSVARLNITGLLPKWLSLGWFRSTSSQRSRCSALFSFRSRFTGTWKVCHSVMITGGGIV